MKTIVLSFGWNCYPIWIYDENYMVDLNDLPDEWKNQKGVALLLDHAQDLYDSAFINTPQVFDFIGFQNKDYMDKMNSLLEKNQKLY